MSRDNGLFVWSILVAVCCLTGCWVRTVSKPGPKLELKTIEIGRTTREEILREYQAADTGVAVEGMFLGRWVRHRRVVKWYGYGARGGISETIAPNPQIKNFVIEFDDDEIVRGYRTFSDKDLLLELATLGAKQGAAQEELSYPRRVKVHANLALESKTTDDIRHLLYAGAELVFTQDRIEYVEFDDRGPHGFAVAPEEVERIALMLGPYSSRVVTAKIRFSKRTPVGRTLIFEAEIAALKTIVRYLRRLSPQVLLK